MAAILLPLFAACIAAAAASTPLVLVDSVHHSYVRPGPDAALDKSSTSALVAGATGLMPGSAIGADLSRLLSGIFKPSPLAKPKAFVVLNVAGLSAGVVGELFSNRERRIVELTGDGCPAHAVVNGLSQITSVNSAANLAVVDQLGVQNCKDSCLEQNLAGAAADFGLDLSGLDLAQKEAKLFAVELGSAYSGLKGQLAAVQKRSQLKVSQDDIELYEVSLMGLCALVAKDGVDASTVATARNAVSQLLKWAVDGLDAAYEGDLVYQVLLLEKGPAQVETVAQLANWKDLTRRQLLQAPYPEPDQTAQGKLFSAKAAGYGAFILLLYFSLAAIWCMCNMPFKQDTLLYGSKKEQ